MKKMKRITAIIGIVLLLSLYIITLFAAIFSTPATAGLFKASLFSTMVIPIMIYIFQMFFHLLENKDSKNSDKEKK